MEHESESEAWQCLRPHLLVFWLVHFLHLIFSFWRWQTQYIRVIIRGSVVSLGPRNIHAYKHSPKVGNLPSRSCTRIHCLWLLGVWWPQDAPVSEIEKLMKTWKTWSLGSHAFVFEPLCLFKLLQPFWFNSGKYRMLAQNSSTKCTSCSSFISANCFIYQLFFHEFSSSPLLPNLLQPSLALKTVKPIALYKQQRFIRKPCYAKTNRPILLTAKVLGKVPIQTPPNALGAGYKALTPVVFWTSAFCFVEIRIIIISGRQSCIELM